MNLLMTSGGALGRFVGIAAVLLAVAGCGRPDDSPQAGGAAPAPAPPAPVLTGDIALALTGGMPHDVAALAIDSAALVGGACGAPGKAVVLPLDPLKPLAVESTGFAIGPTCFDVKLLNAGNVSIGEAKVTYTVHPGKQTMPAVTIHLANRPTVLVAVGVPAIIKDWSYAGPILASACGDCHDGTGAKDNNKKFDVKSYPLAEAPPSTVSAAVLGADALRRVRLASTVDGYMPKGQSPLTALTIEKLQNWLTAGMPQAPTAPAPTPPSAPATLASISVNVQELWDIPAGADGVAVVPVGVGTTVVLTRKGQSFVGAAAAFVVGARYRLTSQLLDANGVLLRQKPDVSDVVFDGTTLAAFVNFTGL